MKLRFSALLLLAVCTDCHGIHNISGVGTPELMARRPQTCGRKNCHPCRPASMARAKIHRSADDTSGGAVSVAQDVLRALVVATMAATLLWFLADLLGKRKKIRRP